MAITYTGSGGLFTRLGKLARVVRLVNKFRGDGSTITGVTTDLQAELESIRTQYASNDYDLEVALEGIATDFSRQITNMGTIVGAVRDRAQKLLLAQVAAQASLLNKPNLSDALVALIANMQADAYYVGSPTITFSNSFSGSNEGDGLIVTSTKDGDGKNVYNLFAESLQGTCTRGNTLGSERWQFVGREAQTDNTQWDWPKGSGVTKSISAMAAGGSGTKVLGGTFETFSGPGTPSGWTQHVGSSTTIKRNTTTYYDGAAALELDGNGSELTEIRQNLTSLTARTPYALCLAVQVDSVPAAGVLTIDLYDGSAVIADEAGTNNTFTQSLTSLSAGSWFLKSAVFRLPEPVPSTVTMRVRLSTALSNTTSAFIDHLSLQAMTEMYDHGPWAAIFSGSTAWSLDDTCTITAANNRSGKWQGMFDRWFSMRSRRLLLPYSGTTLINDNLMD